MARWAAAAGVIGQIRGQLRKRIRREMGRAPGAVATVIDPQPVKAADTVGRDSRGYDAGKKSNVRKRHLVEDTKGLPLFVMVTPADMTDRNAAKEVLFRLRLMHPEIAIVWADSASAGQLVTWVKTYLNLTIKTVSRPKDVPGFVVLSRPWVVERSHAWVMHAPVRPTATDRLGTDGQQCHQDPSQIPRRLRRRCRSLSAAATRPKRTPITKPPSPANRGLAGSPSADTIRKKSPNGTATQRPAPAGCRATHFWTRLGCLCPPRARSTAQNPSPNDRRKFPTTERYDSRSSGTDLAGRALRRRPPRCLRWRRRR